MSSLVSTFRSAIRVTIVEGPPDEDVIIRISDSGGGLPDLVSKLQSPTSSISSSTSTSNPSSTDPTPSPAAPQILTQTQSATISSPPLPAATREFDFELDHSDQAFYGSDPTSLGAPMSPHQSAPPNTAAGAYADPSSQTQWPFVPTPVGPQTNQDPLVDVLCSFSNVRRRLEIEAWEESERERLGNGGLSEEEIMEDESELIGEETEEGSKKTWWNGNQGSSGVEESEIGLGSRGRMNALRKVGTFKGE